MTRGSEGAERGERGARLQWLSGPRKFSRAGLLATGDWAGPGILVEGAG